MSKVPFEIRPAVSSDAEELLRLRHALWPDDMDAAQEIAAYLASPPENAIVLVAAKLGAGLAGFIEMGLRGYAEGCGPGPIAYIEGWYVDADLRGLGVGLALVRAGEDWAKARGLSEIASDALITNEGSIAAHRALGFTEVERIVCFWRSLS
ncbi:GNAT family N-acetyltransferase [Geminicoccus flavidas]|uniref:GNAT family N-acetyltransferase n=1 Tax=Geminicoccus flavidas TaxID=2506407 RepID=UPI00135B60F3|nr:GNAT family N-acetyltransferase [Geminicoccus flavidas]